MSIDFQFTCTNGLEQRYRLHSMIYCPVDDLKHDGDSAFYSAEVFRVGIDECANLCAGCICRPDEDMLGSRIFEIPVSSHSSTTFACSSSDSSWLRTRPIRRDRNLTTTADESRTKEEAHSYSRDFKFPVSSHSSTSFACSSSDSSWLRTRPIRRDRNLTTAVDESRTKESHSHSVFGEQYDVNERDPKEVFRRRDPKVFTRTDVIPVVLIYQEEEI